jgi:hypothetical protein
MFISTRRWQQVSGFMVAVERRPQGPKAPGADDRELRVLASRAFRWADGSPVLDHRVEFFRELSVPSSWLRVHFVRVPHRRLWVRSSRAPGS